MNDTLKAQIKKYDWMYLTKAQEAKLEVWKKEQDNKILQEQLKSKDSFTKSMAESGHAYYGACGGAYTYSFTPNSIGVSVVVQHSNGEKIDLTDYDSW